MPIRQTVSAEKAALFNKFGRGKIHMDFVLALESVLRGGGDMSHRVISSLSAEAVGVSVAATATVAPANGAWPTANAALFVPFTLVGPFEVRAFYGVNGATAAGNLDFGIFDGQLTRVVSTGSVAQAGTSGLQVVNVPLTVLSPGNYWLALAASLATATFLRVQWQSNSLGLAFASGLIAASFPLPARVVGPLVSEVYLPIFGVVDTRLFM